MELQIYDKQGIVKMTVSPDNSSQWNHEVGVENVVTVNFTTWEFLVLEVGWYILVEGHRFSIKSEYRPKHIHNSKYTYNLKFYGREHDTQDILFCRLNQGEDDLESVFAYDGTPMEFLNKVVANMNRNSDGVVWKAGEAITANRQTINFNGLYCWDALGEIARTFGTEWWMDGEYVNLSKCIRGESVPLGYGEGLKSGLTQNENTNAVKWFTRLIPVGSTKNIDKSKYGYTNLQLPGREKYIDINTQYGLKEYREEAAFSEIYPHRVGTISSVRSEARINENLDEYTVYYVKDTSLPFNPDDYMLPGEVIHMTFNTGALAGKEFEVNWNNGTLEFEIINQYPDEDTQWPGGNLIPSGGDLYVLSNISMPDEYNTAAEKEYQEAVDAYLEEYSLDISIYTGNTDYIYVAKNNVPLSLGQRVRLVSDIYFGSNGRDSRITRVSRKLNNLGEATIECGNTISASWTQKISSNINNVAVTQKSDQQKINKNEKDITSLSGLWELKETDSGEKYLFTPYNILTLLGLTSFSTGKAQKFPSIYDGLAIDNQTIYWEETVDDQGNVIRVLKAKLGIEEGGIPNLLGDLENVGEWANAIAEEDRLMVQKKDSVNWVPLLLSDIRVSFENVLVDEESTGNAFTSFKLSEDKKTITFKKELTFVDKTYLEETYYTMTDSDNTFAKAEEFNSLKTSFDDFLNGEDVDTTINKWKELESFLSNMTESDNLATILSNKAETSALESLSKEVDTKWTQDDVKILDWDTAFGWGDHSKAGYALKTYVDETFIGIKGDYTIEGIKNFVGSLQVNGQPIVYDVEGGYWKLDGDLLVTGGITSFADDTAFTPSTIMDGLVLDPSTLGFKTTTDSDGNVIKQLTVIGGTGSGTGGLGEDDVKSIIESYGYLTSSDLPTFDSSDFSVSSSGKVSLLGARVEIVTSTDSMSETDVLYVIV